MRNMASQMHNTAHAAVPPVTQAFNLGTWLAQTAIQFPGAKAAIIVLAYADTSRFDVHSAWPHPRAGTGLVPLAERCLCAQEAMVQEGEGTIAIAIGIGTSEAPVGVLAFEIAHGHLTRDDAKQAVTTAARYLDLILLGQTGRRETHSAASLKYHKELLQMVCSPIPFTSCTIDIVNSIAISFSCMRVGLGLVKGHNVRLHALSHSAWFDPKSMAVRGLENAMEESLDQRAGVVLPCGSEQGLITAAHRELAAGQAACSVILAGGDGLGYGVLYLERATDHPFQVEEVASLTDIAQMLGPVLETKDRVDRWIGGRMRHSFASFAARLRDPRRPALRAGMAAGAIALASLTALDVTWTISADAVIEGEKQLVIAAPFEGFVATALVKAGQAVRKGQLLAELDTRQLRLDLQRWSAEEAQFDSRYRDALFRHDRPAGAMAMAQMQQAQAQRALAEDKLSKAAMKAPFDAFVVSGDLSQQVGSPVEQGKVLFGLAPLDAYRIILKVDERDIRAVRVGQRGRLMLSGLTQERFGLEVTNISIPEVNDGRNVFRVEARLERATSALRPGMQGVAQIQAGEKSLFWIWTHSAWNWLLLQAWKWSF
jgi:hypothetical protein